MHFVLGAFSETHGGSALNTVVIGIGNEYRSDDGVGLIVAAAINELSEREKIVVTLYYFEGLTLAEIGEILGVTESRVCQIHTKAVGVLRGQMTEYD